MQKHFFVAANDDAHNLRMHFEFWGVKSNMQNIVCLNSDTSTDFDSLGFALREYSGRIKANFSSPETWRLIKTKLKSFTQFFPASLLVCSCFFAVSFTGS